MIIIPWVFYAFILIIVCNCFLGRGKGKWMRIGHIILSSIFSLVGIVGMIINRPQFMKALDRQADIRNIDADFVAWAISKYDAFWINSMIIISVIILASSLYLVIHKNKGELLWPIISFSLIGVMIINIIAGVCYGLGTINKLFDVAVYVSQITVFEFLALHIPFVIKRFLEQKTYDKNNS